MLTSEAQRRNTEKRGGKAEGALELLNVTKLPCCLSRKETGLYTVLNNFLLNIRKSQTHKMITKKKKEYTRDLVSSKY